MSSTPVTAEDSPRHGAASDPFQPYCDEYSYYADAAREKRLNLLLHLAPYSDVLLVTGEEGSGKTTFIRRFLATAGDNWRILTLQGGAALGDAGLLEALDRELSVRVDEDADRAARLAGLRRNLLMLRRGGLLPILLIDDAHLLPQSAFDLLAELTVPEEDKERLISIVLAGEAEPLRLRLAAPGGEALRGRVSHTLDMPPFSEADTASYINHRLAAAGEHAGDAFTPAVYRFIHTTSRGVPARINESARVVLDNRQRREPAAPIAGAGAGALLRYGAAALVLSLVAVALVYRAELAALLPKAGDESGAVEEMAGASTTPPGLPLAGEGAVLPGLASAGEEIVSRGLPLAGEEIAPAGTAGDTALSVVDLPSAGDEESVSVADEPAALLSPADETSDDNVSSPAKGRPGGVTPPSDKASVAQATADPVPATSAEKAVEKSEEKRSSATVAAAPLAVIPAGGTPPGLPLAGEETATAAASALRRESWLMAQPPRTYTIQLFASDEARILSFIAEHKLHDQAAVFQARSGEKALYAIGYGVYPDRAAAEQALAGEPLSGIRGITPWVRSLQDIQTAITTLGVAAGM